MVARRVTGSPVGDWAGAELTRNDPASLLQAGAAIGRFDSREWIGELNVPTAVVVTRDDQLVHPHRQLALAKAIPGSMVFEVRGGHAVCVERPSAFVPALVDACMAVSSRRPSTARR